MCGICGIIDNKATGSVQKELLERMCISMKHRGPDGEGFYLSCGKNPSVGLGHTRLKIIDLSDAGKQPMGNEDATVWMVFNGEIYNYKDLRMDLENAGHNFKSDTDTEVIIHLYEDSGKDCVKYLRGMFAFAIWDEKQKVAFLARDRFGKKPLLYYHRDGVFCFASEFSAMLENSVIKKEVNPQALDYYLTFGYIPAPLTIYKDVFKLPPAHILSLENNSLRIDRYWELQYSDKFEISEEDAKAEILRLLKEATRLRLSSDVPLGAFLSGGIDSSTVVALMSQLMDRGVKTFSIGFEEKDYSELKFARNIARMYDTQHYEFIVRPRALEILPLLVERYGEPYADSSAIPTFYVSRETRQYVTVALNGDGGDELFGGYERYQAMLAAELYRKIPTLFKKIINLLNSALPDSTNQKNQMRRIKRFFDRANLKTEDRYMHWVGIFGTELKRSIYSEDFKKITQKDLLGWLKPYLNTSGLSLTDKLLMVDTNTYLPNDLLVKVDIASMANSLEARSPFLDHKLAEFVARLPARYKINGFVKKYILKNALRGLVPAENIERKKMGFGVPVGEWLKKELKDFLYDNLLCRASLGRGYFNTEAVKEMIEDHTQSKKDYTYQLWALLMLELWHRRFMN